MLKTLQLGDDARWRQRFRAPYLFHTCVARGEPTRGIARCKMKSQIFQIYAWHVPSGDLRQLTHEPHGVSYGWLTPDGEYLIYLQDQNGSELGHLVQLPFDGGEAQDLTPDLPSYTLRGVDISRSGNRLAFDAVNENGYRFYCLELSGAESGRTPRLIFESQFETWESILSYTGELLAVQSSERAHGRRRYSTRVFDTASGEQIAELWDGPEHSVEPVLFSPLPDDMRLLATTTQHGGWKRPVIWNPRSGERLDLRLESLRGEVVPLDWRADGSTLLLNHFHQAQQQLLLYDLADGKLTTLDHPRGSFRGKVGPFHCGTSGTTFGPDGQIWANWQDAANAPQLIALDPTTHIQKPILKISSLSAGHAWRSITFTSSDDTEIQGWLGLPEGEGPFPTILNIHGGPHWAITDLFSPASQVWLDHGFAWLTINYRGSTGFGRKFREQIDGDVGHWELEDILAARQWLIDQDIAQPASILLNGGSYGGFLTVWALSQRPTLWAGGMAPIAIVDWSLNYEDASDALKGWSRALFGGTPSERPNLYRERSPSTYAEQIQVPLIVCQSRHDSRATPRQMEVFEAKMNALGKDFEIVWFDIGHGISSAKEYEQMIEHHLRFAYRVLDQDSDVV